MTTLTDTVQAPGAAPVAPAVTPVIPLVAAPAAAPAAPRRNIVRRALGAATRPVRNKLWEYSVFARHGRPETLLVYGHGFGDHLLCTPLFHELRKRKQTGLWMMSDHKDLFRGNPSVDAVVPMDWRYPELAKRVGGRSVMPNYAEIDAEADRSMPPDRHIISKMCQHLDLTGKVELRPYIYLTEREKAAGRFTTNQIAVQSSILSASMPIRNKEWIPERFAAVVEALSPEYSFVQIGSKHDPALPGVIDMRGKTSVRQTAAILSQSMCFVGLVGFLMHLARAVDCRAVIVYGGREAPWQSGYSCNENVFTDMACSPCWLWSKCDHGRRCMTAIEPRQVVDAVERQLAAVGEPLVVDVDDLGSGSL
jgi:ADP-heptose:LPS heptosyltransferase